MAAYEERFARVALLVGAAGSKLLREASVTVVGLGAVGSYAVEGLARAGVGHLTLIDFDELRLSNCNRQLYALSSTLGRAKCDVAEARVRDINPDCDVTACSLFVDQDSIGQVLQRPTNLLIDAIDALSSKVALITAARKANQPFISCLGAALRRDPTKVRIGTIEQATHCPLARHLRKHLRKREVALDFPCVYSDELLPHPLPIIPAGDVQAEKNFLSRGRERSVLGSLPTLTGIMGLVAANYAIQLILAKEAK